MFSRILALEKSLGAAAPTPPTSYAYGGGSKQLMDTSDNNKKEWSCPEITLFLPPPPLQYAYMYNAPAKFNKNNIKQTEEKKGYMPYFISKQFFFRWNIVDVGKTADKLTNK